MGLKEKRAVKEFQDGQFPGLCEQIAEAAGFPVEVEVKWDTLAVEGMNTDMYGDAFTKIYFQPVIGALKAIAADDMGKEALKESLKKVVFCNEKGVYGDSGMAFDGGALTVDHKPFTNIDDVSDREKGLTKIIENAL